MVEYEYRVYCDICKECVSTVEYIQPAVYERNKHFDKKHPDNPMKKANCRIQRFTV